MGQIWTQATGWSARRHIRLSGPMVPLFVLLFILLIVPLLVLAFAAVLVIGSVRVARGLLTRMRAPNGMLDGRRNVRVIERREDTIPPG
jgi:hypothetical protein